MYAPIRVSNSTRFYELLEALKHEFEAVQNESGYGKFQRDDYEMKRNYKNGDYVLH